MSVISDFRRVEDLQLYVASRTIYYRAEMWRQLRDNSDWKIVSTWIDEAGPGETSDWPGLWQRVQQEIAQSDGFILYAEWGDFPLKGALVEVGMALALDKPVAVVFDRAGLGDKFRPLGSWINHKSVRLYNTVYEARLGIWQRRN